MPLRLKIMYTDGGTTPMTRDEFEIDIEMMDTMEKILEKIAALKGTDPEKMSCMKGGKRLDWNSTASDHDFQNLGNVPLQVLHVPMRKT